MSLITKERKLYPRDIARCQDEAEAQDVAMLIALQNLNDVRELEPFENGAEAMYCEHCIGTINNLCREWCFSLADIGTTEEELSQLFRKHVLSSALHDIEWLRANRRRSDDLNAGATRSLRVLLLKGGYVLADIGTTEAELAQLALKKQAE